MAVTNRANASVPGWGPGGITKRCRVPRLYVATWYASSPDAASPVPRRPRRRREGDTRTFLAPDRRRQPGSPACRDDISACSEGFPRYTASERAPCRPHSTRVSTAGDWRPGQPAGSLRRLASTANLPARRRASSLAPRQPLTETYRCHRAATAVAATRCASVSGTSLSARHAAWAGQGALPLDDHARRDRAHGAIGAFEVASGEDDGWEAGAPQSQRSPGPDRQRPAPGRHGGAAGNRRGHRWVKRRHRRDGLVRRAGPGRRGLVAGGDRHGPLPAGAYEAVIPRRAGTARRTRTARAGPGSPATVPRAPGAKGEPRSTSSRWLLATGVP